MADKDHCLSLLCLVVDQPVKQFTASLGQGGGSLVHNDQFRIMVHHLGDLDQLPVLHIIQSCRQ